MTPARLAEIRALLGGTWATGVVPVGIAVELLACVDELREPDEPASDINGQAPEPDDVPDREDPPVSTAPAAPEIPIGKCTACCGRGYIAQPDHGRRICGACRGWE